MNEVSEPKLRYRGDIGLARFAFGEGREAVYSQLTRVMRELPLNMVRLLSNCNRFSTIDEHARRLSIELELGAHSIPTIKDHLKEMAEAGLMIESKDLLARMQARASGQPNEIPSLITDLCVPTRNQPVRLIDCLASFAECSRSAQRELHFWISDQSDREQTRRETYEAMVAIRERYGISMSYLGAQEKTQMVKRLAEHTGHSPETISFAVEHDEKFQYAYGANRNTLLLATVGRVTMQTDDDTRSLLAPSPEYTAALELTSEFFPLHMKFVSAAEDDALDASFAAGNIFAVHEQLLGRSLSQILKWVPPDKVVFSFLKGSFLRPIASDTIGLTFPGTGGDAGIGNAYHFLREDGERRSSLIESEESYKYALTNQRVTRWVSNFTITEGTWCSSVNMGIDNRMLLPPFLPMHRNSDMIFAHTYKAICAGYLGHVPGMIKHVQRRQIPHDPQQLEYFVAQARAQSIILSMMRAAQPKMLSTDATLNLSAIAERLVYWGCAPQADFEEMVRLLMIETAGAEIASFEHYLKKFDSSPSYWARDVHTCIAAIRSSIVRSDYIIPRDLRQTYGDDGARVVMQKTVLKFGRLLQIWPDLREGMQQLSAAGFEPGRRIRPGRR